MIASRGEQTVGHKRTAKAGGKCLSLSPPSRPGSDDSGIHTYACSKSAVTACIFDAFLYSSPDGLFSLEIELTI